MNYENIPQELRTLNQWSVYKTYVDKDTGKTKKIIISPNTAKFAKCDDSTTWTDFDTAKKYAIKHNYEGLVFALTKDIVFIDLDHAIDKTTSEITNPKAKQILEQLPNTYTEKSVSGTGIHIMCKGNLPSDCYHRNDKDGIEIYDNNRFVCMTGDIFNDKLQLINDKLLIKNSIKDLSEIHISSFITHNSLRDYSTTIPKLTYDFVGKKQPVKIYTPTTATKSDASIISQIRNSKQAYKFNSLYNGNTTDYPSHSHAESTLVYMLAWWTQSPTQIDSIIRSSGLIRDKWDSRRGNTTYGYKLIHQALSTVTPRQDKSSSM